MFLQLVKKKEKKDAHKSITNQVARLFLKLKEGLKCTSSEKQKHQIHESRQSESLHLERHNESCDPAMSNSCTPLA